jgi:hypothetical protein
MQVPRPNVSDISIPGEVLESGAPSIHFTHTTSSITGSSSGGRFCTVRSPCSMCSRSGLRKSTIHQRRSVFQRTMCFSRRLHFSELSPEQPENFRDQWAERQNQLWDNRKCCSSGKSRRKHIWEGLSSPLNIAGKDRLFSFKLLRKCYHRL